MPAPKTIFPAYLQPFVDGKFLRITTAWQQLLLALYNRTGGAAGPPSGWVAPTGVGSSATFNMNAAFPVSNPPTQAEVQAIAAQVVILQKRLGQLIIDQLNSGQIGPP